MNTFTFDSSWNRIKGRLMKTYGALTDDDLTFVEGKGEELLGKLQSKLGLTRDALANLLTEMKDGGEGLADTVRAKVSDAAARAGQAVEDVKSKVSEVADETYEQVRRRAHSLQEGAETYVTEQPVKAMLIALGIGFLAGVLIRR